MLPGLRVALDREVGLALPVRHVQSAARGDTPHRRRRRQQQLLHRFDRRGQLAELGSRSDVGVQPRHHEARALRSRDRLGHLRMPDAVFAVGSAGLDAATVSCAKTGVHAQGALKACARCGVWFDQIGRANIDADSGARDDVQGSTIQHVAGQLDALRRKARLERALDLVAAGGVDTEPVARQRSQEGEARVGLLRIAHHVEARESRGLLAHVVQVEHVQGRPVLVGQALEGRGLDHLWSRFAPRGPGISRPSTCASSTRSMLVPV